MTGRRRRAALPVLLALLLPAGTGAGPARAQGAAEAPSVAAAAAGEPQTPAAGPEAARPEIPVTPLFVLRDSGPVPLEDEELHPGEVLGLRVDWPEGPPESEISLAAPGANLGQVVPLTLLPRDPRAEGATVIELLVLGLGETELPSIPLRLADGNLVGTAPVTLETVGVLDEDDREPSPARAQATVGLETWGLVAGVLAIGLPIALLSAWLVWRRRRPAPEAPAAPPSPPEAPEVWAHRSLDELLDSELLANGRMKEFHVRLAEIAKEYLSRRYHLHLVERTTYECPGELRRAGVETALAREIGKWLEAIDLVKFAGEHPPSQHVVASAQALRDMIDRTTPKPEPPELPAAAAAGGSEA